MIIMQKCVVKVLVGLAILSFVLGVIAVIFPAFQVMSIMPESYSRGSNNLALLAIAISLGCKKD